MTTITSCDCPGATATMFRSCTRPSPGMRSYQEDVRIASPYDWGGNWSPNQLHAPIAPALPGRRSGYCDERSFASASADAVSNEPGSEGFASGTGRATPKARTTIASRTTKNDAR